MTHISARPFTIKGLQHLQQLICGLILQMGVAGVGGLVRWEYLQRRWGWREEIVVSTTRLTLSLIQRLKLSIEKKVMKRRRRLWRWDATQRHPPSPSPPFSCRLCSSRSRHPPPPTGRIWPQRNPVTSRALPLPWRRE